MPKILTKNEKISQIIKIKWQDPKYRKRICLSHKGKIPWNKGIKTGLIPKTAFKKGHKQSLETIEKRRLSRSGYRHSEETKEKISKSNMGKIGWNKDMIYKRAKCIFAKRPNNSGVNHYKWIADRTKLSMRQKRNDYAYKDWVKKVKNRDNWQCRINNQDCSGYCIVHHILSWSSFPELRYEVNNGITLCQAHHPRKRGDEIKLAPVFQKMVLATAN